MARSFGIAPVAFVFGLALVACSPGRAPMAPAAAEATAAPADRPSPSSVDAEDDERKPRLGGDLASARQALDESEREFLALFDDVDREPANEAGPSDRAPAAPAPRSSAGAASPAKKSEGRGDDGEAAGEALTTDRCAIACKAISSMRRAADRVCDLLGDDDGGCSEARGRVERSRRRVERSCSACDSGR